MAIGRKILVAAQLVIQTVAKSLSQRERDANLNSVKPCRSGLVSPAAWSIHHLRKINSSIAMKSIILVMLCGGSHSHDQPLYYLYHWWM